ncbi:MAG: hypothetical protein ABWY71_00335 [Candidatus Saccharimonadales bacterium]
MATRISNLGFGNRLAKPYLYGPEQLFFLDAFRQTDHWQRRHADDRGPTLEDLRETRNKADVKPPEGHSFVFQINPFTVAHIAGRRREPIKLAPWADTWAIGSRLSFATELPEPDDPNVAWLTLVAPEGADPRHTLAIPIGQMIIEQCHAQRVIEVVTAEAVMNRETFDPARVLEAA